MKVYAYLVRVTDGVMFGPFDGELTVVFGPEWQARVTTDPISIIEPGVYRAVIYQDEEGATECASISNSMLLQAGNTVEFH